MMHRRMIHTLCLALAAALSLTAPCAAGAEETEAQSSSGLYSADIEDAIWFGDLADFHATTLEEEPFTLEDFADYDVVVINFWATWCGPCVMEMPDLAEFEKELPDNVRLITCCIDYNSMDQVQQINDDAGYEGITLIGGSGDLESIATGLQYIPTTLFFDGKGRAVGSGLIGSQPDLAETYEEKINGILAAMGKPAMGEETGETETEDVT